MRQTGPRVCLFTNVPAPYRLPVFERLNEHVDLTVAFFETKKEDRLWDYDLDEYSFEYEFLNGLELGGSVRFNPGIVNRLQIGSYDACIIGSGPKHFPSVAAIHFRARRSDTPCIIWTEGIDVTRRHDDSTRQLPLRVGRRGYDLLRKIRYRAADAYIAYSGDLTVSFLKKRGVNSDEIFAGTQVMPASLLPPRSRSDDTDYFTVSVVSYLQRRKGIQTLIRAVQRLDRSDLRLIIAGKGPYQKKLETVAGDDPSITFRGYIPEQEKWDLYASSDLSVLPTFYDTWGLVVNEALYYGTPVITTDAAGASQLVNETGAGDIIESGDVNGLSRAIQRMMDDEKYRKHCKRKAEHATKAWDVDVGVKPFVDSINYVI